MDVETHGGRMRTRYFKWTLIGIILLLTAGCGIFTPQPETPAAPEPTTQPTDQPTQTLEPTQEDPVIPSPEANPPRKLDLDSVSSLQQIIQYPMTNPMAAAWQNDAPSFSTYSMETLKTFTFTSNSAINSTQLDQSAQFLDVSHDGTLIALTRDMETVEIIDSTTSTAVQRIEVSMLINSVDFSMDNQRILVSSMDEIKAVEYDLVSGHQLGIFTGFEFAGPVYSVTYAPLSHDLIWVSRGTAMVQNMDSQQISTTFYHEDFINSYTLNADGSMLVVATARTWEGNYHPGIQVWNRNTGEDLGFITTESLARGLALTNDGSLLFGSDGNKLCAWNPASGALVAAFEGHQDLISFVSLSPDNRRILTGSFDNTVILWGVQP